MRDFLALIVTITTFLFTYCSTESVCVIGDVQADYDSQRDPRTIMGTYTKIKVGDLNYDKKIIDISSPIYEYSSYNEQQQYLFKIKQLTGNVTGWALSETLSLDDVFLTCFQDSLFDCVYTQWFWGYNNHTFPISTLKVLNGECESNMCLKNLTIQLVKTPNDPPEPDDYSILDGEFNRTNDPFTNRYQWINIRDNTLRWYYRVNEDVADNDNWVYSENQIERISCTPGSVDMPLFCTTFDYAPSAYNPTLPSNKLGIPPTDGGYTVFKLGTCVVTIAPTVEPTFEPTIEPTFDPTDKPTVPPQAFFTSIDDFSSTVNEEKKEDDELFFEKIEVIIAIVVIGSFLCLASILLIIYLCLRKRILEDDDDKTVELQEIKDEEELEKKHIPFTVTEKDHAEMLELARTNSLSVGLDAD